MENPNHQTQTQDFGVGKSVMRKSKNTYSIHYFAESWRDGKRASGWRNWTITREIVNTLVQIKRMLKGV